jgi:hypothetical protein
MVGVEHTIVTTPESEIVLWQRRLFGILDEFFERAYGCGIAAVPEVDAFGDWIRANAEKFGSRGAEAHTWLYDQLARFYEESRNAGMFELAGRLGGAKLVLGGSSRFMNPQLGAVRKMVLYADTILIPDPILPWVESPRSEERFRDVLLAQNAFVLLHLKPLVDADLPYPPIMVFPSWEKTLELQDRQTREGQLALVTGVLGDSFGHSFGSFDEVAAFAQDRSDDFLRLADQKQLLIGPGGKPGQSLQTSIRLYREDIDRWRSTDYKKQIRRLSDAEFVLNGLAERIGPMYHLFENATELIANPMMPLAVHWYYYRLCSRFFEHRLQRLGLLEQKVITEIEALESPSLDWLGNITIDALVELRLRGDNETFRSRMREYTVALQGAALHDINRVAAEISRGISSLILEHQNTIREINDKYNRHHVHTALLAGVTIAAAILPTVAPLVGSAAMLAPVGKLIWDIASEELDTRQASRSLMGILADAKPD